MTDLFFVKPRSGLPFVRLGYTHDLWVAASDSSHAGITFELVAQAHHGGTIGLEGPSPYVMGAGELTKRIRFWKKDIPKRLSETLFFRFENVVGADVAEGEILEIKLRMDVVTDAKLRHQKETGKWPSNYLKIPGKKPQDVSSPP